jgi:phthiodiolone/phenolphthiodiolone dimycocerosates ketoreductase
MAITPCFIQVCLIGEDDAVLSDILQAPLVKAFLLQVSAETLHGFGFDHPMGAGWRGFQDIDPAVLTRARIVEFLAAVQPEMLLAVVPHGTPKEVADIIKTFVDAGLRVPKILDYGAMAGLGYAQASAANVLAAEDELLQLCGDLR